MGSDERFADNIQTLGDDAFQRIRSSKILVIGAGGIGCELLKNLVLTGFRSIETVDLDTIDLSNLNRQFLFRKQHIGQSKAKIASEAVKGFVSDVDIVAHQANVKDSIYGAEFVSRFDLVLMALDNLEARKHVNRLCVAAGVPAIESGTAGYLGQVQVIRKGETECYECQPKKSQNKEYASCTINNTPSKPIHCIVWAKEKFRDYFSEAHHEEEEVDEDAAKSAEAEKEILKYEPIRKEEEALEAEKKNGFARWLFRKLFHRDILVRLRMGEISEGDFWKGRKPPVPTLPLELDDNNVTPSEGLRDMQVWSLEENVRVFYKSAVKLYERHGGCVAFDESPGDRHYSPLSWDKDDVDVMDFVASASNIRSIGFHIPTLSRFELKSKAGNIIPAIATTNAIIAGVIVLEAIKILTGRFNDCKYTYLMRRPSGKRVLMPVALEPPNPKCFICSCSSVVIRLNTHKITLSEFVDSILFKGLGMAEPMLFANNSLMYESSEDMEDDEKEELEERVKKTLHDVLIRNDTIIRAVDEIQQLSLDIRISQTEEFDPVDEADTKDRYEIVGTKPVATASASSSSSASSSNATPSSSSSAPSVGSKRKAEDEPDNDSAKRVCTSCSAPAEAAAVADDDDDDIVIL